ncbi:MAG: penicillin-binding protein 1C [Okeania sp. SIO2G4]|uniref:penicillin-binding protein 1C n=1 Tax=unclassified Okeania TaxID=2634635 RepID=UPI0013B8CD68|nr:MULTISPECIES: penicillin-binding protein 1C [unclassified Okeania]NEP73099.1 penicillin-binding protein 1C [Okeania sp. SIO2G5]NEP93987.1 penicillin-binding protein 1C [Okeania sp. SIO2F5]NEQ92778.1 penicillin-binding protein 1C [Okeania sp. SIO2G4]
MIKITKHISKNIKQKWQQTKPRSKFILSFVLLCLSIRSLPLFAPIRPQDIAQNQQTLEFIDRNGLPLGTILTRDQENTVVVPLDKISPLFINAIIAAEDKRYYQHGALDIKAIGRSLLEAIQAKQIVSGASTITMQLARMLEPTPRTFGNKIREIWLSWRITAGMNKNQILQAYINRLPMGGNIYGVEAASRAYFGISATDLNLAQATILAALPNDPTDLNPYYNWSLLKQRQIYILKRMVEDNYITSAEAEKALAEKITLQPKNQGIIAAPHFIFWLSQNQSTAINQNLSTTTTPTVIRTTIDRPLQQFVTTQVQQVIQNLTPYNVHHAAAIIINNQTGEVLAYVGSPDYFNTQKMGSNDGVQALRQPGSTLKPFLYQLALENQVINPNTILPDVPTYYAIPGAKLYSPTNYNQDRFLGPVIVRVALANSLNIPTVRVLEKVGLEQFLNRLHQLGFKHLQASPEHYGLGLSLGSGEVSLWELAKAYSIMARQGEVIPVVTTIPSKTSPLFQHKKNQDISLLPKAKSEWMLIANMLSDTHARAAEFGVNSALNLPFPAAVKTGTSSDFRDTWTVGFTNDYTVAVWVGNFSGESMVQISGVMGAAPLWNRIMLHLHEKKEPTAFPPPKNMVQRPVCTISGLRPKSDCPSVITEYFYPEKLAEYEHLSDNYSVENLPDEYNEWLAKQSKSSLVSGELKILFPQEDDYFLMDDVGGEKKLEFKLANSRENSVEWWLNGEKLAVNSDNSLFWKLSPGKWTLEVRSADIIDRVNFEVQLPNKSPYNGFSIRIRSQESGVRSQESGGKK